MRWPGLSSSLGAFRFLPQICSSQTEGIIDKIFFYSAFIMAMMLVLPFALPSSFSQFINNTNTHTKTVCTVLDVASIRKKRIFTNLIFFSSLSMMFTQIITIKTYNINNTDIINLNRIECEFTLTSAAEPRCRTNLSMNHVVTLSFETEFPIG